MLYAHVAFSIVKPPKPKKPRAHLYGGFTMTRIEDTRESHSEEDLFDVEA